MDGLIYDFFDCVMAQNVSMFNRNHTLHLDVFPAGDLYRSTLLRCWSVAVNHSCQLASKS